MLIFSPPVEQFRHPPPIILISAGSAGILPASARSAEEFRPPLALWAMRARCPRSQDKPC
jgi:hypothetical protein